MKKMVKKRVLAGFMALVLAGGLVASYGYFNSMPEVWAKEKTAEELKEAAEEVLGDSAAGDRKEFYKDESVYVKADPSGKITETTVTEWLKNPGEGEVADVSELNDIKNIKGEETFSRGSENVLNWDAEGEDIYYQGTTEKELPVDVKISYKLDGKAILAEDLKGQDGKVEIRIDYTNQSRQTVEVNGENIEMYTPFTVATALMLPADEYKNVTIDSGKIISDADKDIVVGIAFPGLKENLNLEELEIDIPSSITITADVKNASVGPTMTLVSSEILSEFGLNDVSDFESLEDSINELQNAAGQLTGGSSQLADGMNTLNGKTGELKNGVNELAEGVNAYVGGVGGLAEGSTQLLSGAEQLKQGVVAAQQGIGTVKAGADELLAGYDSPETGAVEGAQALSQGASTLSQGASALSQGLSALSQELERSSSAALLGDQAEAVGTMASQMAAEAGAALPDEAFAAIGITREEYVQQLSGAYASALGEQISNTLSQTAAEAKGNISAVKETVDQLSAGAQSLASGAQSLEAGTQSLSAGIGQLRDGTAQLQSGLDQLYTGSDALVQGTSNLYDGTAALQKGAKALNESSSLLQVGTQKLKDGGEQLSSGVGQLADGANTLSSGMAEFQSSGIDKLAEVFHGDIQRVTSRIDAMTTLGQNYKSFAGMKEGVEGSTKFIIETEGVE